MNRTTQQGKIGSQQGNNWWEYQEPRPGFYTTFQNAQKVYAAENNKNITRSNIITGHKLGDIIKLKRNQVNMVLPLGDPRRNINIIQ